MEDLIPKEFNKINELEIDSLLFGITQNPEMFKLGNLEPQNNGK